MSDENDNGRQNPSRPSLTLKPRAGSVSAGVVKQSFSHGRSKTVVVETKRVRTHVPGGSTNLAGPSAAEKRTTYDPRAAAPRPAGPAPTDPSGNLSAEEMRNRQRAIDAAREAQERQAAQARARAEPTGRRSDADARPAGGSPGRDPRRAGSDTGARRRQSEPDPHLRAVARTPRRSSEHHDLPSRPSGREHLRPAHASRRRRQRLWPARAAS